MINGEHARVQLGHAHAGIHGKTRDRSKHG
jgi:hypothetical protein